MMPTVDRQRLAETSMAQCLVESVDRRLWGETVLVEPVPHAGFPESDRFLGVRDLCMAVGDKWPLALMEMLTDPVLVCWVPGWVVEQYERANPYFRHYVEKVLAEDSRRLLRNHELLRRVRRRMQRRLERVVKERAEQGHDIDPDEEGGESEAGGPASDESEPEDEDPDAAAARVAAEAQAAEMQGDARPEDLDLNAGEAAAADAWAAPGLAAELSAAGAAPAAPDRLVGGAPVAPASMGAQINPPDYEWESAVPCTEFPRIQELWRNWGSELVDGDGEACDRDALDPWQRFA